MIKALIVLLIGLILVSCGAISHELVALELKFRGPCSSLVPMISSIATSSFTSPSCLPISLRPGNPDFDDLDSHHHCVDVLGGKRSIFRFVEVFPRGNYSETIEGAQGLPAGVTFMPSIISRVPFRVINSPVSGQVSYWLRPSCTVSTDICNGVTQIVNSCTPRRAPVIDGYVCTDERVYIALPNQVVDTCTTQSPTPGCCSYVSILQNGICGGSGGDLCVGVTCDDNNNCTTDSCNPANGQCVYTPRNCNDGFSCTTDSCDSATGNCINTANNALCTDSIPCTNDVCQPGAGSNSDGCIFTPNNAGCTDSFSCTNNICQPGAGADANGCVFPPNNTACATGVTCVTGTCQPTGVNPNSAGCVFQTNDAICVDPYTCTTDSCSPTDAAANPTTGCLNVGDNSQCVDASQCTLDVCAGASGNVTSPRFNTTTGCENTPNNALCNDNRSCTRDTCNQFSLTCTYAIVQCPGLGCTGGCNETCVGNFPVDQFGNCANSNVGTASCYPTEFLNNQKCLDSSNPGVPIRTNCVFSDSQGAGVCCLNNVEDASCLNYAAKKDIEF